MLDLNIIDGIWTHLLKINYVIYKNGNTDRFTYFKKILKQRSKLISLLKDNIRNSKYTVTLNGIIEDSNIDTTDLSMQINNIEKVVQDERIKIFKTLKNAIFIKYFDTTSQNRTIEINCLNGKIHCIHGPALIERRPSFYYNHYYINGKKYTDEKNWKRDSIIYLRKDKINKLKLISPSFD
jgi:hypothetical protein